MVADSSDAMNPAPGLAGWRLTASGPGWGLGILRSLFRFVPMRVGYVLTWPMVVYWFLHFNRPRAAVVAAMERMGADRPMAAARKAYFTFACTLVERAYVAAGRIEPDVVHPGGRESHPVTLALQDPSPLMLLGSHCGVWEMSRMDSSTLGRTVRAVALPDPGTESLLADVGDAALSVGGVESIVADGSMAAGLKMLKAVRAGEVLCLKADRPLPDSKPDANLDVDFFGARATFPAGPANLIKVSKARAVALFVFRTGPAQYEVVGEQLALDGLDAAGITQAYATSMEQHLRTRPDQWFNFYPFWAEDRAKVASLPETVPPGMRRLLRIASVLVPVAVVAAVVAAMLS
jgi:predicted LPLAT superfamily acyltransferase